MYFREKWVFMLLCIVIVLVHLDVQKGWGEEIPLPEHPRPEFMRPDWLNLNGSWSFQFDIQEQGLTEQWYMSRLPFDQTILVPFPWGSPLSGISDQGDIGWYGREITLPDGWHGKRIFLLVGASDWHTRAWLDGNELGEHRGGYTPFEFELTACAVPGQAQYLVLRVDDSPHPFKLEGKQGYGRAAGIWQTIYLEARPSVALQSIHFTPDIDKARVSVAVRLDQPAPASCNLSLHFNLRDRAENVFSVKIAKGVQELQTLVTLANPRLWSPEDPYLYEVAAKLTGANFNDQVSCYFGMRKISIMKLPGSDIPYIALNNKPIYLQLTLDQAYHPQGYYTFPSDAFMRDEILRTRRIGLNGQRVHVKIEHPRKLYWADRLGVLIMADVPNSWGEPDAEMRRETETALTGMIQRDYNHPSIFSWVVFNETWGLRTGVQGYTPETQQWVASMLRLAKKLDPTRLVEDNSPCNLDHVETDINSWHAYLPGYAWEAHLDKICADTYPGSKWNFIGGRVQGGQPNLNSECGNVWGYQGSTGDVDWSWDYHMMMNAFRRHPRICGWLYTEHHDVINEWNGYYRFDRSDKYTGLEDLVPGMSLRDLHSPVYLATESELCRRVEPGETVQMPLYLSAMTDFAYGKDLDLKITVCGWTELGDFEIFSTQQQKLPYQPWMNQSLAPISVCMPAQPALVLVRLVLCDQQGAVLHRNFTTYLAQYLPGRDHQRQDGRRMLRLDPSKFAAAEWSAKQWSVLDGLKVNGAGAGFFEYRIPWPKDLDIGAIAEADFRLEVSAKQLFAKDRAGDAKLEGDYMRGKGSHDPGLNANSYPMKDEGRYPSALRIRVNGLSCGIFDLADDAADHRGILSWFSQPRDKRLREAGSYGELVIAHITPEALRLAAAAGEVIIRLEVDPALPGGLAIYGARFGRYPLDPTLLLSLYR